LLERKAASFDHRGEAARGRIGEAPLPAMAGDGAFIRLSSTKKAATFTGDSLSLTYLRHRIERSNFVVRQVATAEKVRAPSAPVECLAVVDAFSTGACLAHEASRRGYGIVHVLSLEPSDELAAMVPAHLRGALPWLATLNVDVRAAMADGATKLVDEIERLCADHQTSLVGLVPGAETGVKLADELSARIRDRGFAPKVCSNGTELTEARRNKADMGEAVRAAGVRAVRQLRADRWPPVAEWLETEWGLDPNNGDDPCLLIVKPLESAGSDGVTKCDCVRDVRNAVEKLVGSVNGLGQINEGVLVQEFLQGTEYVIDSVSRDGVHKVVGIWVYDRRPTNGHGFVLHGQAMVGSADPVVAPLVAYAKEVLNALNINHGPAHMELKMCPPDLKRPDVKTPCLVEVGARCHGAEGFWISIADETCRHNQAIAALDAYIDPPKFRDLPPLPPPKLYAAGCIKYLLTHQAGVLQGINQPALDEITNLESYRGHEVFLDIGKPVIPTKDCFSWGGCVKLVHPTQEGLERDYAIIERLCLDGLWRIV